MLPTTDLMLLGSDLALEFESLSGLAILLELKTHWSIYLSAWAIEQVRLEVPDFARSL